MIAEGKLFFWIFTLISFLGFSKQEGCSSPQHFEIGERGILSCDFMEGFYSIYWYNSSNYVDELPSISYETSTPSGPGYDSGEFDIDEDGSLIINQVKLQHETTFTGLLVKVAGQLPHIYQVNVLTEIIPVDPCPVINKCDCSQNLCYQRLIQHQAKLTCSVNGSRPEVPLRWQLRTDNGYKDLEATISRDITNIVTSTEASVTDFIDSSSFLETLICIAEDNQHVLKRTESLVVVRNSGKTVTSVPETVTVKLHSQLVLNCPDANITVWEKRVAENDFETISVSYVDDNISEVYQSDYLFHKHGSLLLSSTDFSHEGVYMCTFLQGQADDLRVYNVQIQVDPDPSYLVIDGCDHSQYCILVVQRRGILKCSVTGIRPAVELQWRTLYTKSNELISFSNEKTTTESRGETFQIVHTVEYNINKATDERLTIECLAVGSNAELFDLSTKIDLFTLSANSTVEPTTTDGGQVPKNRPTIIIIVTVIGLVITLIIAAAVAVAVKVTHKGSRSRDKNQNDEEIKMLVGEEVRDNKSTFISQLKQSYELFYKKAQPVPYDMERTYPVNELFVDVGTEYLINKSKWVYLGSHSEIFKDERVKSERRIIEAEPGYGKTTLVMQLAYEWCAGIAVPVSILIVVRLRQLRGVSSIYEAIKRFLLPRESTLEVETIREILSQSHSVLIILDGFDEYPESESISQSDVFAILQKQMFPHFDVILTTRSACLPKQYAPQTKRIRLTGFDAAAQDKYLQKVVTKNDETAANQIKEWLQDNPVLGDLCQVPLFFVIYAHLSQENEQLKNCSSVTVFFRYMVSCLENHLRRKLYDENVEPLKDFQDNHTELSKLAFEALSSNIGRIEWTRDVLENKLGKEFVDRYLLTGVLREQEYTEINDTPGTTSTNHITIVKKIRFYHSLFCEWYAAHYVAEKLSTSSGSDEGFTDILEEFDLNKFQYMYRFACGLNPTSARHIINYAQGAEGSDKFATLCILEQKGSVDAVIETVKHLCSKSIHISNVDSRLLQRSVIQLLAIAFSKEIKISRLILHDSFMSVDLSKKEIVLKSGLRLPSQITIEELWIEPTGTDISGELLTEIFSFCLQCEQLRRISFSYCLLPFKLSELTFLSDLMDKKVEVMWHLSVTSYGLNMQSGHWQHKIGDNELTEGEYKKEVAMFQEIQSKEKEGDSSC